MLDFVKNTFTYYRNCLLWFKAPSNKYYEYAINSFACHGAYKSSDIEPELQLSDSGDLQILLEGQIFWSHRSLSPLGKPLEFLSKDRCVVRGPMQRRIADNINYDNMIMLEQHYHVKTINMVATCYCHGLVVCPTSPTNHHRPGLCSKANIFYTRNGML